MKKLKDLRRDERGGLYILILIFLFIILCMMVIVSEVIRVHDLKEHLDNEIYRAANLSIKTAMYDCYRIDSTSKFDEKVAVDYFYSYLKTDLGLTESYVKLDDMGNEVYRLTINSIEVNGDTVRMNVKATAYAKPAFNLWNQKWEIPIDILSRNIRTD